MDCIAARYAAYSQGYCVTNDENGVPTATSPPIDCSTPQCPTGNALGTLLMPIGTVQFNPENAVTVPQWQGIVSMYNALPETMIACHQGCQVSMINHLADPGSVWYNSIPSGADYALYRPYDYDSFGAEATCVAPGQDGTYGVAPLTSQEAGIGPLEQTGGTGTANISGNVIINEAGTSTPASYTDAFGAVSDAVSDAYTQSKQYLEGEAGKPSALPSLPSWDFPSPTCQDLTITLLGVSEQIGLCNMPLVAWARTIWAWYIGYLCAMYIWSLALKSQD